MNFIKQCTFIFSYDSILFLSVCLVRMNSDTSSEVILFLQNPEFFKICAILDRKIHTIEMLLDPIQKFCLKMAKIEGCLD